MNTPPPAASARHWSDRCGGTPSRRARSSAAQDTASRSHCSSARVTEPPSPPFCVSGNLWQRIKGENTNKNTITVKSMIQTGAIYNSRVYLLIQILADHTRYVFTVLFGSTEYQT